jgi:SAM-dependent methyltransferase
VRLLPRAAFGSDHATTRLCLEALQDRALDGLVLADVGCGSGVLAIAARLLGAAHVSAVDIDPVAVDAPRDNAALNGVTLQVQHGGCELLEGRAFDGVAFLFGHLQEAFSFARVLSAACIGGGLAGTLALAGVGAHAMALGALGRHLGRGGERGTGDQENGGSGSDGRPRIDFNFHVNPPTATKLGEG